MFSPPVEGLRVGYVLKKYPRLSETFILDEILGLEAVGVELAVLSLRLPDDGRFHGDLARVQAKVAYLPDFGLCSVLGAFDALDRLEKAGLAPALRFLELFPQRERAKLLVQALHLADQVGSLEIGHLHAHFMTVAAHVTYLAHLLCGVPFSATAHAKDVYRHTVDARIFRKVAGAAEALVTVCEANRAFIRREILGQVPARLVRIYNGVFLDQMPTRVAHPDPRLVVGVGRMVEKKGFDVLLGACRLLSERGVDFRLVLVGDGEEWERLDQERRRLGLEDRVHMVGPQPRDEVLRLMAEARVIAAPCVTGRDGNQDALPTVLLEAMALGLPAVSTAVGGIPEIVGHERQGLLVPERDHQALAAALERVLTDDVLWARLSAAGRAKARERFDRKRNLQDLVAVFQGKTPLAEPVAMAGGP
ncbi:MAG: glycosyltransferase [Acidimicrobiia bacterium]